MKILGQKTALCLNWFENLFVNCIPLKASHKRPGTNANSSKITDINIDCLEAIFSYLSLVDLLNVADSNNYLREAAAVVFVQKFGKKPVQFNGMRACRSRKISIRSKLFVRDLKSGLQLMRCFGQSVSRLEISDEYSSKYRTHVYVYIFQYIYQFCKLLASIKFQMLPRNKAFKYLRKPFRKVESVEFFCCYLEKNLTPFNILFPNVRSLKIDFCNVSDYRCIEQRFNRLEHLQLSTSRENIQSVLLLNPDLKHFSTKITCDMKSLENMSTLQSLESLDIVCSSDEFAHFNGSAINFDSVKKFKLDFSHAKRIFPNIPLVFNQLEEFSTNHRLNAQFYDFIAKHPRITKLSLPISSSSAESVEEKQFEFLKTLHSIREVNLCRYAFSVEQAIRIFDGTKRLNKFCFSMNMDDKFPDLVMRSKHGWSARKGNCAFHRFFAELQRNC